MWASSSIVVFEDIDVGKNFENGFKVIKIYSENDIQNNITYLFIVFRGIHFSFQQLSSKRTYIKFSGFLIFWIFVPWFSSFLIGWKIKMDSSDFFRRRSLSVKKQILPSSSISVKNFFHLLPESLISVFL